MSPRPAALFAAACVLAAAPTLAFAETDNNNTNVPSKQLGSARIIEWDMPADADFNPGAMVVDTRGEDNNTIWFVTRIGGQKVYRFDLQRSLMSNGGPARWTSWDLVPGANMGGIKKLRPSHDRRYIIVRTSSSIQEVDTQACAAGTVANPKNCATGLRRWDVTDPESPDADSVFVSDIAVDDGRRIFTVGRSQAFPTGYLQVLVPTKVNFTASTTPINAPYSTVTRWKVDGVNQCQSFGISGFCNSGVDFHPQSQGQNLVYFSDQGFTSPTGALVGAIGELNISNGQIRRWPMPADANGEQVSEPRMLKIDSNGTVWVVTGSGHLVSLNPKNSSGCSNGKNKLTRHRIPAEMLENDGFGIAPDSNVIGYTDANNNKVGMLIPHDGGLCEAPVSETTTKLDIPATVTTVPTVVVSDVTTGDPKTVLRQTTKTNDGTYVEAVINQPAPGVFVDPTMKQPDSLSPLGISPVKSKSQGTFFYAVGFAAGADVSAGPSVAKRIGFVRLGIPERINNPRDDDDDDDGHHTGNPNWKVGHQGDEDGDGVPDEDDMNTSHENMTGYDPAPLSGMSSASYPVTVSTSTLALIAAVEADPLAQIAVDVYNALGVLSATSGPLVGVAAVTLPLPTAGDYTVKVRNLGTGSVSHMPTVVVREPAIQ